MSIIHENKIHLFIVRLNRPFHCKTIDHGSIISKINNMELTNEGSRLLPFQCWKHLTDIKTKNKSYNTNERKVHTRKQTVHLGTQKLKKVKQLSL